MFHFRLACLLMAALFSNYFQGIYATEKYIKVGIDSVYSVIDCSNETLFFFDNGRVFSMRNSTVMGVFQEFSPEDKLVDLVRIKENSFIMLVHQFKGLLTLRNISVDYLGSILLNWDLDLDISVSKLSRKLLFVSGKLYLTIENHYFVIDESNGRVHKHFSLSNNNMFLLINFDEKNKQSIVIFNELEYEIQIYDFISFDGKLNTPIYKTKIEHKKRVLPNSGIITISNGDNYLNLLLVNQDNNIELFTINLVKKFNHYLYSKVSLSSLDNIINGPVMSEITLTQINSGEIAITLSNNKYNIGFQIVHLFEPIPSYILKSFIPMSDGVQSSNAMIFQDEVSNSKYIIIINYNDLTNNLSITTIFNYFLPINLNKIFRYNLKIEYFNKRNKIIHGSIKNLIYSAKMGLLLQWNDSLLASISLNCDATLMKCHEPKINNIYEGIISSNTDINYFENNFLFYFNGIDDSNKGNKNNSEHSTLIEGTYLYDMYNTEKKSNNLLIGTIMLTINKNLSVFAYNIDKHNIIWRNDSIRQTNINSKIARLFITKNIIPELIIIVDQLNVLKINIFSGETISYESYDEASKLIVSLHYFKCTEQKIDQLLILLDKNNKILKLFGTDNANDKGQSYFYFTIEHNIIKCNKIDSELRSELHWQYIFDSDEMILLHSTPECSECKSFPVIVDIEYNIVNRFDHPHLLGVITSRKRVLLFNSMNGNLIYSSFLPETFESPHKLKIFQNIVLITSYHSVYKIPVFVVLELYQFIKEKRYSGINIVDKLIFLISPRKNVDESRIYPERQIHIQQTSFLYNYELTIDHLEISKTSKSITSKMILFGNEKSNIIEGIPEKLFTTLKPNGNKSKNYIINSQLPAYQTIIPSRIKFTTKFGSRKTFSFADSIYESKSKLVSVGFNSIEIFELSPSTKFDHLPDDFNYGITTSALFSVTAFTAIAIFIFRKNKIKKWI